MVTKLQKLLFRSLVTKGEDYEIVQNIGSDHELYDLNGGADDSSLQDPELDSKDDSSYTSDSDSLINPNNDFITYKLY